MVSSGLAALVSVLAVSVTLQLLLVPVCEAGWQSSPDGFRMLAQKILKNKKKFSPSWPIFHLYPEKRTYEVPETMMDAQYDALPVAESEAFESRQTRGFGGPPLPLKMSRYMFGNRSSRS